MSSTATVEFTVRDYRTGTVVGQFEADKVYAEDYAAEKHPAFQWPQGIGRAGDVLPAACVEAWAIDPDLTVYLD